MVKSALSRIEEHEEVQAVFEVKEAWRKWGGAEDMPTPAGFNVLMKLYIRSSELKQVPGPDGKLVTLYAPDVTKVEDQFNSVAALVLAHGPQAYIGQNLDGSQRFPGGPWCKPGDWVMIPRHEGMPFLYAGIACIMMPDDRVQAVIGDPAKLQRINTVAKV